MEISWELTALAFFDQLSADDQKRIEYSLKRLANNWDQLQRTHLQPLKGLRSNDGHSLLSLRAGSDLRVLLYRQKDRIIIVDVVRHSQIERLRSGR